MDDNDNPYKPAAEATFVEGEGKARARPPAPVWVAFAWIAIQGAMSIVGAFRRLDVIDEKRPFLVIVGVLFIGVGVLLLRGSRGARAVIIVVFSLFAAFKIMRGDILDALASLIVPTLLFLPPSARFFRKK